MVLCCVPSKHKRNVEWILKADQDGFEPFHELPIIPLPHSLDDTLPSTE
jgi:hypothetical protein